jgi:hypothetical protein
MICMTKSFFLLNKTISTINKYNNSNINEFLINKYIKTIYDKLQNKKYHIFSIVNFGKKYNTDLIVTFMKNIKFMFYFLHLKYKYIIRIQMLYNYILIN